MDRAAAVKHPAGQCVCVSAPCRGGSMRGTLKAGDRLWLASPAFESLEIGDVVAFEADNQVRAHRIVGCRGNGYATHGDGNARPDLVPLTAANYQGKVVARERNGSCARLAGGLRGHCRGKILRGCSRLRGRAVWMLGGPYRMLRASRLVARLWQPRVLIVHFAAPGGSLTKFIRKGRTVAVWTPQAGRWECRRPYDLVLFPPSR